MKHLYQTPLRTTNARRILLQSIAATFALATTTGHATLVLNYDAANYNAATGVWTDTSASADNATAPGTKPTKTLGATPNGHAAVTFTGINSQDLDLATALNSSAFTSAPSFTLMVVARHTDANGAWLLSGNSSAGTQGIGFRIDGQNGNREVLTKNNVADLGTSTLGTDFTAFHLFDVTYDGTTVRFSLDGVANGTVTSSQTFLTGILQIGLQAGTGAGPFKGDIAGIQVYNTVLSGAALTSAEGSMASTYGVVPEPSAAVALLGGCGLLLGLRRWRA